MNVTTWVMGLYTRVSRSSGLSTAHDSESADYDCDGRRRRTPDRADSGVVIVDRVIRGLVFLAVDDLNIAGIMVGDKRPVGELAGLIDGHIAIWTG